MHGFIERDMGNIGSIPLSQHHIIMLTLFINDLMNVMYEFLNFDFMNQNNEWTGRYRKLRFSEPPIPHCVMDWSGFEPEAFPVQGGRYTRFNYQPL